MTKQEIFDKVSEISKMVNKDHLNNFIKKNYPELYSEIEGRTIELNKFKKFRYGTTILADISIYERLYCIEHDLTDRPKCQNCGKEYVCDFNKQTNEYKKWCCPSCQASDPSCIKKAKCTKKEKYGDENYVAVEKARETRYKNHGGKWVDDSFSKKVKETKLKNHGDPNFTNTEKRLETVSRMIEEDPDYYKKRGEKMSETKMEKYGDPNYNNRDKFKETLSNFTDEKRESIKEARRNTCIERYGVDSVAQVSEIRNRIYETNIRNIGVKSPLMLDEVKENNKIRYRKEQYDFIKTISKYTPLFSEEEFVDLNYDLYTKAWKWKCNNCGEEFYATFNSKRVHGRCPKCEPRRMRVAQTEVFNFIKSLGVSGMEDFKEEVWGVIDRKFIDMCSVNVKFGIEYDGLFWHSPDNRYSGDRVGYEYHMKKTDECESKGYRLLHVLDIEWVDNRKLCSGIIRGVLGVKRWKIDSSECEICEPSREEVDVFLLKYSFEPSCSYSKSVCLKRGKNIVSMIVLEKSDGSMGYQIARYATLNNFDVVGDIRRMTEYFFGRYDPEFVSLYLDRRWFSEKDVPDGFCVDRKTKPNLKWFHNGYLYKKEHFRGIDFVSSLPKYDPEKSMADNMADNGYMRYYDCGNIVCVMRRKD